ncbi:MAG TPA: hypothetical protein VH054_06405 [Polyangiaceae bacterium]|jgi:hypothetical protein|nr:hypothetical protein [Polyangiaceae bacterium]
MARARSAFLLFVVASGCNVYGPTLLVGDGGGVDAPAEACATQCSGKCVDTQTDQNNCGACGVTCETGCGGGVCTPTLLAGGLYAPHGILINGSQLFVANSGSINVQSMSKIDGTGLKNFATSQLLPQRLVASPSMLYWTNDSNNPHPAGGRVEEAYLDGTSYCNPQNQALFCYIADDLPAPYGLAIEGDTLFITTTASTNNAGSGCATDAWASSVLSCSATNGCASVGCATSGGPGVIASSQTQLAGITADATNVYWADTGAHAVRFCPQPTCGVPQTFVQLASTAMPFDVFSDGKTVYTTDRSGTLYACPTSGCAGKPTVIGSNIADPLLVAADSAAVFVTSYASGEAGKGSIVGCALPCSSGVTTIASGLRAPYGIAIDSGYVYWSEEGSQKESSTDGVVRKIKRPF